MRVQPEPQPEAVIVAVYEIKWGGFNSSHPPRTNHGPTNRCGNCAAFVCSVQLSHVGFSARCFLITPSECCLYVGHPLLLLCITHLNILKRERIRSKGRMRDLLFKFRSLMEKTCFLSPHLMIKLRVKNKQRR